MTSLRLRFRKLHPAALAPAYAHGAAEDAGMDLHAAEPARVPARGWASVGTGLAIELPAGFEGQVRPRSGLAARHGIGMLNAPGTIDPGYRGEIRVLLVNHSDADFEIRPGDRIAQLVVAAYAAVEWECVEDLADSRRGDGGFGSTGR